MDVDRCYAANHVLRARRHRSVAEVGRVGQGRATGTRAADARRVGIHRPRRAASADRARLGREAARRARVEQGVIDDEQTAAVCWRGRTGAT